MTILSDRKQETPTIHRFARHYAQVHIIRAITRLEIVAQISKLLDSRVNEHKTIFRWYLCGYFMNQIKI